MAIKKEMNFKGILCPNAYHKIIAFWSTEKNKISCTVITYFDEAAKIADPTGFLKQENHQGLAFDPAIEQRVHFQMYEALKLLPEFDGAIDV